MDSMQFVHFIGIEGVGTSAAAKILMESGIKVSGSDLRPGEISKRLYSKGATIFHGHGEGNVSQSTDTVIASAAIMDNNPELILARKRGLRILSYNQLLGNLMSRKIGLSVAGTHGKTTTSGMLTHVLRQANLDPSFVIGGIIPQFGGNNGGCGSGEYFVAESCEFKRSFLNLCPKKAIITNIEADHLDYYNDFTEIKNSFGDFANLLPQDGLLVIEKDALCQEITDKTNCPIVTYSLKEQPADWQARIVTNLSCGYRFIVKKHGKFYGVFENALPGHHNVSNAMGVIALADHLGIDCETIAQSLMNYGGAKRRFDILAQEPLAVIDDYAHHPTEIKAVLQAARDVYGADRRIWCVFQPHQASRTYHLLDDFATSFGKANEIIIPNIFYARDTSEDRCRVSSADLVAKIRAQGQKAYYMAGFEQIENYIKSKANPGDVVMCLGAGDIYKLAYKMAKKNSLIL